MSKEEMVRTVEDRFRQEMDQWKDTLASVGLCREYLRRRYRHREMAMSGVSSGQMMSGMLGQGRRLSFQCRDCGKLFEMGVEKKGSEIVMLIDWLGEGRRAAVLRGHTIDSVSSLYRKKIGSAQIEFLCSGLEVMG